MYYIFCRVSYQSTILRIEVKCRRRCQRNQKNQPAHAVCVSKNSQKKEENALVARHAITKRVMSVTRRSSQVKG
jgi:hypothetical protein